jgi:pimeloyl-ACP methyl ester carboxylesterase
LGRINANGVLMKDSKTSMLSWVSVSIRENSRVSIRENSRFKIRVLAYIWIIISCSGCFTRWVMSEREVKAHYALSPVKPTFITIRNDSVELFCATTGSDTLPPLLLIHGAPGGWFSNIALVDDPDLQSHYHIISVSRPGYHKSKFKNKRKALTSIELQAIAIHEALRLNRSFKKGVVFGTSYGAPIAAKMAISYPDDFYHLVLVAGALDPDNEKFWWFHQYLRSLFVRLSMPHFINTATDEKFAHVGELQLLLPQWPKLQVPATVVQGTRDEIVPVVNFEFAKNQLQNKQAEFISIPGAGHMIRRSHPQVIRDLLLRLAK